MITGKELVEKLYSEKKEERKHKISLEDINSHRGLGRATLLAVPSYGGSLVGGYVSKKVADSADREGLSDEDIKKKAEKYGAITGMGTGAAIGLMKGHNLLSTGIISGLGALGGYLGANKNVKVRLKKRKEMEEKLKDDSKDKKENLPKKVLFRKKG